MKFSSNVRKKSYKMQMDTNSLNNSVESIIICKGPNHSCNKQLSCDINPPSAIKSEDENSNIFFRL